MHIQSPPAAGAHVRLRLRRRSNHRSGAIEAGRPGMRRQARIRVLPSPHGPGVGAGCKLLRHCPARRQALCNFSHASSFAATNATDYTLLVWGSKGLISFFLTHYTFLKKRDGGANTPISGKGAAPFLRDPRCLTKRTPGLGCRCRQELTNSFRKRHNSPPPYSEKPVN